MSTLILGRAYDWSSCQIKLSNASRPFSGIESLDYTETREKEFNYGSGKYPISLGEGNHQGSGQLMLQLDEVSLIKQSVPSGSLLDIKPFDIIVRWQHPDDRNVY